MESGEDGSGAFAINYFGRTWRIGPSSPSTSLGWRYVGYLCSTYRGFTIAIVSKFYMYNTPDHCERVGPIMVNSLDQKPTQRLSIERGPDDLKLVQISF